MDLNPESLNSLENGGGREEDHLLEEEDKGLNKTVVNGNEQPQDAESQALNSRKSNETFDLDGGTDSQHLGGHIPEATEWDVHEDLLQESHKQVGNDEPLAAASNCTVNNLEINASTGNITPNGSIEMEDDILTFEEFKNKMSAETATKQTQGGEERDFS